MIRAVLLLLLVAQDPQPRVWQVDGLVKIFKDDLPPENPKPWREEAARGEFVSLQVVIRSETPIDELTARILDCKFPTSTRFVAYVPVKRKTNVGKARLRDGPCDYPDPLLENASINVPAGQTQPVWITVEIPADALAGLHRFGIELKSKTFQVTHPLEINVHPVTVPKERTLLVTNWMFYGKKLLDHSKIEGDAYSEAGWNFVRTVARNQAEHRANVILTNTYQLVIYKQKDGQIEFDFSRFDRWVEIFLKEGFQLIEGSHLAHRRGKWTEPFTTHVKKIKDGRIVDEWCATDSADADEFYGRLYTALAAHLKEKGWHDKYVQHVADEPVKANFPSYLAAAKLVRKYMSGIKTVDAIEAGKSMKELEGHVDIWVPVIQQHDPNFHTGKEVWIYTCVQPQGEHANRFIEQPLVKPRLLHWLNYKLNATGYLHWGFNAYYKDDDPMVKVERPLDSAGGAILPAGDSWIVYPKPGGILDSIRHEAMRDGIEDYELLKLLHKKDPKAAQELVNDPEFKLTKSYAASELAAFHRLRLQLLMRLADEY
jgi:hypothetical protein